MPRIGNIWKTGRGTSINTALISVLSSGIPLDGEPVYIEQSGHTYTFMPTTPGSASAANRTIAGLLVWGHNPRGALYNPGIIPESTTEILTLNIGGRGSRAANTAPTYQRFLAPITGSDEFVVTRRTATAIQLADTGYAWYRAAAQDYFLDQGNAQDVLRATAYYSVDIDNNIPISSGTSTDTVARVWCKASLPGGQI